MFNLSKLSDYAIVLMSFLATHEACRASASTLAQATRIPKPSVIKLLKLLASGEILQSIQGRGGGYRLTRTPSAVSLVDIIEAVEGPIAITECNREAGECRIQKSCRVQHHWLVINGALREALDSISLTDLANPGFTLKGSWQAGCTAGRLADGGQIPARRS